MAKGKLTEKYLKDWLKDLDHRGSFRQSDRFERKLRMRLRKMLQWEWEVDEYILIHGKVWRTLLWKEVTTKFGRQRVISIAVKNTMGRFTVEYSLIKVPQFVAWLNKHGRGVCPECYEIVENIWLDEHETCLNCKIRKQINTCQVCGMVGDNKIRPWDIPMCKHTGLHSMRPLCNSCRKTAYVEYSAILDRLKVQNPDVWAIEMGYKYLVKVVATPVEGDDVKVIYGLNEYPTKKQISKIRLSHVGYLNVDIKIEDLDKRKDKVIA